MTNHIREALQAEDAKIDELERSLEIARARRQLLMDLLQKEEPPTVKRIYRPATPKQRDGQTLLIVPESMDRSLFSEHIPNPISATAKRNKPLSENWKKILRFIGFEGKEIKEIWDYVRSEGMQMERNNIRSQCSNMSNKLKYLRNMGEAGKYCLTDIGAAACGYQMAAGGAQ